jgi:[ribosomal protein S5]-alanine N-acetyltransferase
MEPPMIRRLFPGLAGPPPIRLEGPRCVLRPALLRDWRDWAALRAESRGFLKPWEPEWATDALSRSTFERRLRAQTREWRSDLAYNLLIFDRESEALVGGLGLSNVRRGVAQSAMLGYWIGLPYARRGFVAGAVDILLDFSFDVLKLHRIEAACLPDNVASRSLLEKLGFSQEGYAREYLRINGAWRDHVLYAMLAEDRDGRRAPGIATTA